MGWSAAICWVDQFFVAIAPLLPGPREPSPVDLLEVMNNARTAPHDEAQLRMHFAGIRLISAGNTADLLQEMGDFCIGIATMDTLRRQPDETWTLGGNLTRRHHERAGVAIIDPAPIGVYAALRMFQNGGVTAIRRVAGHKDTEYWLARLHGVQVLLEVQTNLIGVLRQQDQDLADWLSLAWFDATAVVDDADAWASCIAAFASLNGFAPPDYDEGA